MLSVLTTIEEKKKKKIGGYMPKDYEWLLLQ